MPPGLLQFAKIVFSAGQKPPTCIWQPCSIGIAEAIRAHAILLKVCTLCHDASPTLTGGLHTLQEHMAGIPGIVMRLRTGHVGTKEVKTMVDFDRSVLGVESAPIRYD